MGPALDPFLGEVGGRVVGSGRAEQAAAMGSSSVAVALVLGQDRPQMLCVPRISSTALTSRVALPAIRP